MVKKMKILVNLINDFITGKTQDLHITGEIMKDAFGLPKDYPTQVLPEAYLLKNLEDKFEIKSIELKFTNSSILMNEMTVNAFKQFKKVAEYQTNLNSLIELILVKQEQFKKLKDETKLLTEKDLTSNIFFLLR